MISICPQNSFCLAINPRIDRFAVADRGGLVCPASLHLTIKSQFIRCLKRRLGRTVRMKTKEIQPARFRDPNNPFPILDISWRMAGFWENATLQCAPNKGFAAIDHKLRALRRDLPHSKRDF